METKDESDTSRRNGAGPWQLEPNNYLDGYLSLSHSTAVFVGIPLNLAIVATIIGTRRLRNARNFTWLGIGFSSIFLLVSHTIETVAAHWPSPKISALYSWFRGHPYPTILLNLFLALMERHLCLKRPRWHKRWVARNWWIIPVVQVGSSVLVFCLIHAHQLLFESYRFNWPSSLPTFKILSSFLLASYFTSLLGLAALWSTSSRTYLPARMTPNRQVTVNRHISSNNSSIFSVEEGRRLTHPSGDVEDNDDEDLFVLIEGERVSKFDVDAARSLTLSGFIILSSYFPMFVGLANLFLCLDGSNDGNGAVGCNSIAQIMYYQRELISIPCFLVLPVYLVFSSQDLKSVLRDRRRLISLQMARILPTRSPSSASFDATEHESSP